MKDKTWIPGSILLSGVVEEQRVGSGFAYRAMLNAESGFKLRVITIQMSA